MTTIQPSKQIAKFVEANAVAGTIEHNHPQMLNFTFANGRTATIFLLDNGRLDSTMVCRGGNVIGHPSTLKGLAALGQ